LEVEFLGSRLLFWRKVLHALHHGRDLQLLARLPIDKRFDVGVVGVEHDHLGRPAGGASTLDGPGGTITNAQETHQPRRGTTATQRFARASHGREVGAVPLPYLKRRAS
jgi:hypothetical protein